MPTVLDLVKQLYEAFGGGPLAAMVALVIAALVLGWALFVRETKAHLRTTREVVALTSAVQSTWQQQLNESQRAREEGQRARELQERALQVQETSLAVLRSMHQQQA